MEYVLMLSRDEALERARHGGNEGSSQHVMDDGVFEGDFDDIPTTSGISMPSPTLNQSPPPSPPISLPHKTSISSLHSTGSPYTPKSKSRPINTPGSPSRSNQKIQVSPRRRKEPREAGFGDDGDSGRGSLSSSLYSSASLGGRGQGGFDGSPAMDDGTFPSISAASASPPSRLAHRTRVPRSPVGLSPSLLDGSPGKIAKGAWTKPLSSSRGGVTGSSPGSVINSSPASGYRGSISDEMDEDMRMAIQLSLESAEEEAARRRT